MTLSSGKKKLYLSVKYLLIGSVADHVEIDSGLEDIVPSYIERRKKDIPQMLENCKNRDFSALKVHAHGIKGSGGGYGFPEISRLGTELESACQSEIDVAKLELIVNELSDYINTVKYKFV